MAEISIVPLEETDDFDAASVNSRFRIGTGSFEGAVNNLVADALAPGALNHNHLPTLVHYSGTVDFGQVGNSHTYTRTQANGDSGGFPSWVPIDSSGGAGGGTDLELDLGANFNLTGTTVQGVLVLAEIQVALLTQIDDGGGGTPVGNPSHYAKFMIQAWNGAAWRDLTRTIRWFVSAIGPGSNPFDAFQKGRHQYLTVPIRTLVKAADMGNNVIRKVRVVVSVGIGGAALPPANTDIQLTLWGCQLSALVLQSTRT